MKTEIYKHIEVLVNRYPVLNSVKDEIVEAYFLLVESYKNEGKLLIAGNGGSAADAEHIVGELMKGFKLPRKLNENFTDKLISENEELGTVLAESLQGALPAIALDGHPALSTAYMNDCEPLLCFAQQVNGYGKAGDVFFRKLFFLFFVTSLILFRTLLNRSIWMNPLSDVMGGWGIWKTVNGEKQLTTECIENVIMMVPFSAAVLWSFGKKIGNGWKKILWQSGKIAFIFSISIEILQLLLRLGTFQLSDIFYNTVGGMIGGLIYCAVMKARKRL